MDDDHSLDVAPPGAGSLRAQARMREIGRRVPALRFRLRLMQWAYVPLLGAALVGLVVALVLGVGDVPRQLGSILVLAGGIGGLVTYVRKLKEEIADLEEEREGRVD